MQSLLREHDEVFIFLPNLVSYSRIVLSAFAFWYMPTDSLLGGSLYVLQIFLAEISVYITELYNQPSRFGYYLDSLIDLGNRVCFILILELLYPRYIFVLQWSIVLEIITRLFPIFVSAELSAIDINEQANEIFSPTVDLLLNYVNEVFFMTTYLCYFQPGIIIFDISSLEACAHLSFPFVLAKIFGNAVKCLLAVTDLIKFDMRSRLKIKYERNVLYNEESSKGE